LYRLKLIAGLSYAVMTADGIVKATKDRPVIDVDDDTAQTLLSGDNFLVISAESEVPLEGDGEGEVLPELSDTERECEPPYGGKTLEEMNITEIEAFAAYKKVSLKGIRKKDAMIKKLREVLPEEETTGVLEYGSPTMVELQDEK
jgi:hypothetical protein